MSKRFYLLLAPLVLAGCANDPAPLAQMRLTDQAIEQAQAVGTADEDQNLALARAKAAQARAAVAAQRFKEARLDAEQAELDARLAEAQELNRKSADRVAQASAKLVRLRKQLEEEQ